MSDHFLYVFGGAGGRSPSKVGISQNTATRLSTVQTSCPFKIENYYEFQLPNKEIARELELSFHRTQKSSRLYGEWFDIHPRAAVLLLCSSYRAMLEATCPEPEVRRACFDVSGVDWAERRFGGRR